MLQNYIVTDNELYHYGVKGMKWGVRRYQNKDGSLTPAGQKRLAKSIQKAMKTDRSSDRVKTIQQKLYDDITSNGGKKIVEYRNEISAKWKRYSDLKKSQPDYWDSDEVKKDSARAYDETLKWFEKNDKSYLEEIVKANGGRTDGLDRFHDFRKTYEGYEDAAWTAGEKKFNKEHRIDSAAETKAYSEYKRACENFTTALLGKYADVPVSRVDGQSYYETVGEIVEWTLPKIR